MNYDDIMSSIHIQESREESKKIIRGMRETGLTLEENKALYLGFVSTNQKYVSMLPLMLLWIDEVYEEEKE